MFAASFALGEILVADRKFAFYAFAPILYSAGIILGTVLFGARYGIVATAWGAVAGAAAHLAVRAIGTMRTSFRIRPRFAVRTAAFAEFIRLMVPRMFSVAIDPLTDHLLHPGRRRARGRRRVVAQLRARLPGPAGQPHRRSRSRWPSSRSCRRPSPTTTARRSGRSSAGTSSRSRILTTLAAVGLFVLSGTLVEVLLGGGKFGPDDVARTSAIVAAFALSVPFDALVLPAVARAVRDPRHAPPGPRVVRRAGRRHRRDAAPHRAARPPGHPVRLRGRGHRQGRAARGLPGDPRPADRGGVSSPS